MSEHALCTALRRAASCALTAALLGSATLVGMSTGQRTATAASAGGVTAEGASVVSLVPARLLESRSGPANVTTDGRFEGVGRVWAGGVVEFDVLGRGGVP